jgi:uncharacterized protein (TIGR02270 family)
MHVNEAVISLHADDAAFLWLRRRESLRTNLLRHDEHARLDNRLDGHLDGLCIAGEHGWRLCLERLEEWGAPGEIFATTAMALASSDSSRIERVLDRVGADRPSLDAMLSAIGWHGFGTIAPLLAGWSHSGDERLRYLGVIGHAVHRVDPGDTLGKALVAEDAVLRARAAQAAGELGSVRYRGRLRELVRDRVPGVQFHAACSLARLDEKTPALGDMLAALHRRLGTGREHAISALALLDRPAALARFRGWAEGPETRRAAIEIAEALGEASLVPHLIGWMDDPDLARAAGAAFHTITGADLEYFDLDGEPPPKLILGPNDDPDDDRVELDRDHDLAWPSAPKVARWWQANEDRFARGMQYLDGQSVGVAGAPLRREHFDTLCALARGARPRHRQMAAQVLGRAFPERPTIETHAFATRRHPLPGWDAWKTHEDKRVSAKVRA